MEGKGGVNTGVSLGMLSPDVAEPSDILAKAGKKCVKFIGKTYLRLNFRLSHGIDYPLTPNIICLTHNKPPFGFDLSAIVIVTWPEKVVWPVGKKLKHYLEKMKKSFKVPGSNC